MNFAAEAALISTRRAEHNVNPMLKFAAEPGAAEVDEIWSVFWAKELFDPKHKASSVAAETRKINAHSDAVTGSKESLSF